LPSDVYSKFVVALSLASFFSRFALIKPSKAARAWIDLIAPASAGGVWCRVD
jgi:hypothetical protein